MKFSEKLMNLRKVKGLSQEELADKLNVTRQTISKWELDQTVPDMNKLIEISKLFEISLDELVNGVEVTDTTQYEKKNTKISVRIFLVGLLIALVLCGIGYYRQKEAEKTNEQRGIEATEQSQNAIDNAKARLQEINEQLAIYEQQYEAKQQERDALNKWDSDWFQKSSQMSREASNIHSKITELESEKFQIQNRDYTVYYSIVEPITYNIFYYIAAGIFGLLSLIALIYFLVTRKK